MEDQFQIAKIPMFNFESLKCYISVNMGIENLKKFSIFYIVGFDSVLF